MSILVLRQPRKSKVYPDELVEQEEVEKGHRWMRNKRKPLNKWKTQISPLQNSRSVNASGVLEGTPERSSLERSEIFSRPSVRLTASRSPNPNPNPNPLRFWRGGCQQRSLCSHSHKAEGTCKRRSVSLYSSWEDLHRSEKSRKEENEYKIYLRKANQM